MTYSLKIELLKILLIPLEIIQVLPLLLLSFISRFINKRFDIGVGPDPLLNSIYHKQSLEHAGYKVQTFCYKPYFITKKFDIIFSSKGIFSRLLITLTRWPFVYCIFNHKAFFIYFNGGPLYPFSFYLWKFEPLFLNIAGIKTVVLPYGGDVQDLTKTSNYLFKNAIIKDYPSQKYLRKRILQKIDLWSLRANHVIAGCDWIEHLYHWDTLMVSHFAIRAHDLNTSSKVKKTGELLILHAPNHRTIKGSGYIENAVEKLQHQGLNIKLKIIEGVSNAELINEMIKADLIVDQLIGGWYAMFAIEAMSLAKPVVCYLRDDFLNFYKTVGVLGKNDCPIINANPNNIEDVLRNLYHNRKILEESSLKGPKFVKNYHSIEVIGEKFKSILLSLNIHPN